MNQAMNQAMKQEGGEGGVWCVVCGGVCRGEEREGSGGMFVTRMSIAVQA